MLDSICGPQKTYIRSYNIMIYHLISMSTMDIPNTISDNHITCFIGLVLLGKSSPETIFLKTINYSGFHRFQCKKNIPWNQSDNFFFQNICHFFFCEKPGTLSHSRWVLIPPYGRFIATLIHHHLVEPQLKRQVAATLQSSPRQRLDRLINQEKRAENPVGSAP